MAYFEFQVPGGSFPFSFLELQAISLSPSCGGSVGKSVHSERSANAWNLKCERGFNIRLVQRDLHMSVNSPRMEN